ncbi:1986_t:CDS:1, partial [Entrophospora sp. SA101]
CHDLEEATKKLDELKNIVFPNKSCDFTELKDEIARLKIRELAPQLQSQKEQIEKLITDSKKQISEESKTVLDFYLTTLKQEEKTNSYSYERNSLKDGKLAAYEDILKTKLTSEDVQQIRQLQERINQDQKHLDSLQKTEKQEAKVQQTE